MRIPVFITTWNLRRKAQPDPLGFCHACSAPLEKCEKHLGDRCRRCTAGLVCPSGHLHAWITSSIVSITHSQRKGLT